MGKRATTPEVRAGVLRWQAATGETHSCGVGADEWFRWLDADQNTTFYYSSSLGDMTARREKRRRQYVWYAYKRAAGQTFKRYLGPSHLLTADRLETAADWFYHNI